jgi:hypothetical protein
MPWHDNYHPPVDLVMPWHCTLAWHSIQKQRAQQRWGDRPPGIDGTRGEQGRPGKDGATGPPGPGKGVPEIHVQLVCTAGLEQQKAPCWP